MANCLRRNFKSCTSLVLIGRRNQQPSCIDQKTINALTRITKEVAICDYSPSLAPGIVNFSPKTPTNVKALAPQWKDTNCSHHLTNLRYSYENDVIKLGFGGSRVHCARECKAYKDEDRNDLGNSTGRPDKSQLDSISKILAEDLPKLFIKAQNYSVYHPNIVFENNIRGTKTIGIFNYVKELALIRIVARIKYSHVTFQILKITVHPEDGTVRVRWRISGIGNWKTFFSFLHIGSPKISLKEGWYDGFSIFFVRSDGLIHKHIVDKMMPDNQVKDTNLKDRLAAKVAFAIGFTLKGCCTMNYLPLEEMQEKHPKLLDILHPLEQSECFSNRSNFKDMKTILSKVNFNSSQDN